MKYEVGDVVKIGQFWTDEMIERKATTKEKIDNGYSDIEYGDKVKVVDEFGYIEAKGVLKYKNDGMVVVQDDGEEMLISNNEKLEKVDENKCEKNDVYHGREYDFVLPDEPFDFDIVEMLYKNFYKGDDGMEMVLDPAVTSDEQIKEYEHIDNLEMIVRLKQVDNGWVVTVDDGNQELEKIGDDIDNTVGEAVDQLVDELNKEITKKEYKKERKEAEVERLEQTIEEAKERLEELKEE